MQSDQDFNPEKSRDMIMHVAGYRRQDLDRAVININPKEHDAIQDSLAKPFNRAPLATLGCLDSFPVEILRIICSYLDIESLLNFRKINQVARQVVSNVPGYQVVTTHALTPLCALLRTEIASHFTLGNLFDVLCTQDCRSCGDFGGFVFLPSLTRICFPCLYMSDFRSNLMSDFNCDMMHLATASRLYGLPSALLRTSVPVLRTIPGRYSKKETLCRRRSRILTKEAAVEAFRCVNAPGRKESDPLRGIKFTLCYMASTTLPHYDRSNGSIHHGIYCFGCHITFAKKRGIGLNSFEVIEERDRAYSDATFIEHFNSCVQSQELWNSTIMAQVPLKILNASAV